MESLLGLTFPDSVTQSPLSEVAVLFDLSREARPTAGRGLLCTASTASGARVLTRGQNVVQ